MLWRASSEPQWLTPCGVAGIAMFGRPANLTVSEEPCLGRRRT